MLHLDAFYERKPTSTLYHYTDAGGFLGIVNNRCFWATHIRFLNDSKEFLHAREIVRTYTEERQSTATDSDEKVILEHIIHSLNASPGNTYIVSLSQRGDLLRACYELC